MALVNFSNIDFDQIKISIKDYLKSNSNFTDYDFEGSALSTIIDVLAYNTYITSYNANMISNEVFIDSATLRENVVALARNIGYVPRSRTSARANVSLSIDTSEIPGNNPVTLTLKKGLAFTGGGFTFNLLDDITRPVIDNNADFFNLEVIEGTYITEIFEINFQNPNQRIILGNPNIDISTLKVNVRDNNDRSISRKYILANSLFEVNPTSRIFFVQEISDQRYELIFGDGVFGQKLSNLSLVEVSYCVSNGDECNGIDAFTYSGRTFTNNGALVTSDFSAVSAIAASRNGKEIESVSSIRNYAPKIYASQYRAVTATDYEVLVPQLYPETESISVFGGEVLNPPEYGKVFITIKPTNGQFIPNFVKQNIVTELRKYSVAGIVPEILDLKFLFVEFDSSVYYNTSRFGSPSDLQSLIIDNIDRYSRSKDLNQYGARFKYSKFLNIIDKTNESITSNITNISIRRDLRAALNQFAGYEICFGNEFFIESESGYNIRSSGFNISGVSETVYITDIPDKNLKKGKLILFKLSEEKSPVTVRKNVGEIDYIKGEILFYPINIIQTSKLIGSENIIEISTRPKSNDIIGLQDLYLQLDVKSSKVNVIPDTIVSGSDTSGSIFQFSSSYSNRNNIVRN
jgi:hypothetical protein